MEKLLANTKGQTLINHLLGVAKRSVHTLETFALQDDVYQYLKPIAYLSGLLHDIGKVDPDFQKYITSKKASANPEYDNAEASRGESEKKWHGVFHQEISWAAIHAFLGKTTPFGQPSPHDIIAYAAYWHHPPSIEPKISNLKEVHEEIGEDTFTQIKEFLELLFKLSDEKMTTHSGSFPEISVPKFFQGVKQRDINEQAYKTLITACLIEADREVSSWSAEELNEYLKTNKAPTYSVNNPNFGTRIEPKGERSLKQLDLAKKLSKNPISICAVDTGAGKTRISLKWKSFLSNNKKMIIALPKRRQVDALYGSIKKDAPSVFSSDLSIQAVHGGAVQLPENTNLKPLDSDINIVVFDQMLKTFYKRTEIMNFITTLRSDIVFDEYHEFLFIPNMLPSLAVIVKIRSWMTEAKTLFLSGTPNPGLNKAIFGDNNIKTLQIERDSLPEVHTNKAMYTYVNQHNSLDSNDQETLQSFNRVDDALESWLDSGMQSKVFHSRFAELDLKNHIKELLTKYGEGHTEKGNAISAMMLQSSFDCSFKNAKLTVSLPDTVAQFLGRKDRHGDKPGGRVAIFPDSSPDKTFSSSRAGYLDVYKRYNDFLKSVLQEGKEWTHREATVALYDNFWKESGTVDVLHEEIKEKMKDACKNMEKWHPVKQKNSTNGQASSSGGGMFRGSSVCVAAEKVDLEGVSLGMTGLDECISVSSDGAIADLKNAFDSINSASFRDKFGPFKTGDLIGGKKGKRDAWKHGKSNETPLYFSHTDNEISEKLKEKLDRDGSSGYRVYNSEIGLVKQSFINKIKEKRVL